MGSITAEWNPMQRRLKGIILKSDRFNEAIQLCLKMHSMVHSSAVSGEGKGTIEDELWEGLEEWTFRCMPTKKDVTIAWNLWHITRIEDLTANILIADDEQVIDTEGWGKTLNVSIRDTGNSMTDEEICDFSARISMEGLHGYRNTVGRKTRKIMTELTPDEMKRRFEERQLRRIMIQGGVLDVEGSRWLLDFWGRKNVAGILMMPITRHQLTHLNDSLRLKARIQK
jgi:hypothetical protein